MRYGLILPLLVAAAPAHAQSATPQADAIVTQPTDPAHLAAAERVAARIWPDGTWQRQMDGMSGGGLFSSMLGSIGESATAMTVDMTADIYGKDSKEARRAASPQAASAAAAAMPDPADMDRFFGAVMRAMGPIMADIEPAMRTGIANSFARRFTLEQLTEIDAFFATPAGSAYAAQAMTMLADPEIMQASLQIMPRMMEAMPRIMEQVAAESGIPNMFDIPTAAATDGAATGADAAMNIGVKVE